MGKLAIPDIPKEMLFEVLNKMPRNQADDCTETFGDEVAIQISCMGLTCSDCVLSASSEYTLGELFELIHERLNEEDKP